MERRGHRNSPSAMNLKNCCLSFFNEANRNRLIGAPRIGDKVADFIISNRPFRDYEDLVRIPQYLSFAHFQFFELLRGVVRIILMLQHLNFLTNSDYFWSFPSREENSFELFG